MYRNLHNSTRMTNNKMLTFQDMYMYEYLYKNNKKHFQ